MLTTPADHPRAIPGSTAIALCADDFAQHHGVDDAVCQLLAARRLSAVSCMSTAPRWRQQSAPRLREYGAHNEQVDLGLHLNLTENFDGTIASLPMLILRSYAGRLDEAALRSTLARQFDAFETGIGRAPDYFDGHQHVHQLPQVRELLLELINRRYGQHKPWVRNTVAAPGLTGIRPLMVTLLGGAALRKTLKAASIATNRGFGGGYVGATEDYAVLFERWLTVACEGMLLMCHPASAPDAHDPISAQRLLEYRFISSDAFPALLTARGVRIEALSSILSRA